MRHHDHREPQGFLQVADQLVELIGADRIQTGRRFVEEKDLRIQGQGPGETGALAHAAGQLAGVLVRRLQRKTDKIHLQVADFPPQTGREVGVLGQRYFDVLCDGQRGEERPVLKQHAPALLQDAQIAVARPLDAAPEDLDPPGRRAH